LDFLFIGILFSVVVGIVVELSCAIESGFLGGGCQ
jgi:hypothetical protein